MQKLSDLIYNISFLTLKYISIFFSSILFIGALLFSATDTDISTLKTFVTPDNVLVGVLCILVTCAILLLVHHFSEKAPKQTVRILYWVTQGFYAILGTFLILFVKSDPHTDSLFVYNIAQNCAQNNLSDIARDSYLSIYPHQIGLVFFYEPLIRLWNLTPFHAYTHIFLQFINLLLVLVLIYFLYKITDMLFKNTYATCCCLLLTLCCFPLYFYILRIYGDIPSLAFFVIGLWAFIRILSPTESPLKATIPKWVLYLLNILCFFLSVATRKNSIIGLIALMIILALSIICKKKWRFLLLLLSYLLISVFTLPLIQTFYETRSHSHLDAGTPAIAYIAMGMQESPKANGWYNFFNYNVYVESDHNMEFIDMYSKKRIQNRLDHFINNPQDAFDFYFEKYASQWCDGTYASRELTVYTSSPRARSWDNFYAKDGAKIYRFLCNHYQTLLYFGVLLFALRGFIPKQGKNLLPYTFILVAFGGFLFHFLWEANSRAIFSYTVLLLPISGAGLAISTHNVYSIIENKFFT